MEVLHHVCEVPLAALRIFEERVDANARTNFLAEEFSETMIVLVVG
jgi:hypothetical protein